jgi:type IV fimbrial biogenesis protein FimT
MAVVSQPAPNRAEMRRRAVPFIGLLLPFVGRITNHVGPFVGENRPLVLNRASFGFTLVELIVTLVVASVLLALAAPNFSGFVKSNRLAGQANELMADLAFARSEAIKRGANITVCRSGDGANCLNGAAWKDGWIVVDGAGQVLRVHEKLTGENWTIASAAAVADSIVYDRSGLMAPMPATVETISICDANQPVGRVIEFAITGRPKISKNPPSC